MKQPEGKLYTEWCMVAIHMQGSVGKMKFSDKPVLDKPGVG